MNYKVRYRRVSDKLCLCGIIELREHLRKYFLYMQFPVRYGQWLTVIRKKRFRIQKIEW